jgi:hypothetical protein
MLAAQEGSEFSVIFFDYVRLGNARSTFENLNPEM